METVDKWNWVSQVHIHFPRFRDHVDSGFMGVYVLSKDGRQHTYVGRSDASLRQRLVSSASQGDYSYFWFDYASSERNCYLKECELYHRYNPPDNTVHPAVPPGANWRCPVTGCEWGY